MITICPACGNHEWNKEVREGRIFCPVCGEKWELPRVPLLILTGCSGVGKTTTARQLALLQKQAAVLDGDMYISALYPMDQEKYLRAITLMLRTAANYAAAGIPTLWVQAGSIDHIREDYFSRFFPKIRVLALVCGETELRRRMTQGRGITDAQWIESSVDYNRYFMEHDSLGGLALDRLDSTGLSPKEAAEKVRGWMRE